MRRCRCGRPRAPECRCRAAGRRPADRSPSATEASTANGASVVAADVEDGVGIGGVTVELGDQVDGQRGDGDAGIVDHRLQARAEQLAGVGAGAPHVERVAWLPAPRRAVSPMAVSVGVGQVGELHAEVVGEVGAQRAFGPRVVHGRDAVRAGPAAGARPAKSSMVSVNSAMSLTRIAPVSAQNACQPDGVAGQGPRVRGDHGPPARGVRRRAGSPRGCRVRRPRGAAPARSRLTDRGVSSSSAIERVPGRSSDVVDVVGGVGDEFLPRRHRQPEPESAAGPQQGGERRSGVGHQRNPARREADPARGSPVRAGRSRC